MAAHYPPLTQSEINQLFIQVDPPAPNTFEFALVLGGTVSAGAFTAGVVDLQRCRPSSRTSRSSRQPNRP